MLITWGVLSHWRSQYMIPSGGAPMSLKTKKLSVFYPFFKYKVITSTTNESLCIHWILHDLEATSIGITPVYYVHQDVCHNAINSVFHDLTKHTKMGCYISLERVAYKSNHYVLKLIFMWRIWSLIHRNITCSFLTWKVRHSWSLWSNIRGVNEIFISVFNSYINLIS